MSRDAIFSPSFGNRPAYLVGRDAVLEALSESLDSRPGGKERAILLLGQRGSGKTVLLWEVADIAREKGFIVANPTVASDGMLGRIVEKIQDDGERFVKMHTTHLAGGSVGALGFSAGLQFTRDVQETKSFEYKLTQLARRLTSLGRGMLILVDELTNSSEVRQLVIAYQELVGEGLNVALVMAGLPAAVAATLNDKVLTFLNRARKIALEPLRDGDVDAFFARAFDQLGLSVSPVLRRQATQAVQGSPYMLQLVGYYMAAYAEPDGTVGERELTEALQTAQTDYENDVCETTLVALSGKDIEFLTAMTDDERVSRTADIAQRMGVDNSYAQKYRKRLIDAGIIEAAGHGSVSFAVPYLKDYLDGQR